MIEFLFSDHNQRQKSKMADSEERVAELAAQLRQLQTEKVSMLT